ncbi:MAG: VWA domain-containing protein [Armatimonadota bacterium]|nr:VWA domain-containing protein [Armatimonadota bacterium]
MDPNKTQMAPGPDPNRTQMAGVDANRTQAMTAPSPSKGVEAMVIAGRECALANSPAREQYLLDLRGAARTPGLPMGRTSVNLCLVIDRSGSMEGPPLDYVKQACAYVVDMLSPDDVLSIVTFEEIVEVLMPPRKVANKELIKEHISRIVPGNTTNLYDGLSLAAQQLMSTAESGLATRMVVFSDGDPTAGIKDFGALVQHVGEIKDRGISCAFLGFGPDYNEELLAGMAKRAGGNYYYIARPELIPEVFRAELDKLMTVAGRNLKLRLKTARWVTLRQIYGHDIQPGQREVVILLTDLERGMTLNVALDFEFQNHPLGHYRVAAGSLEYDDAVTGKNETVMLDFVLEFTSDAARCSVDQDQRVAQCVEVSIASRAVEKTMMGLKSGQITEAMAVAELQKTQMLLAQDGRGAEAQQVGQAIQDLKSGNRGSVEKTLMGAVVSLDQGKTESDK